MNKQENELEKTTDGFGQSYIAKLVICEDDRATLELLCDHLQADRYNVLAAPTAADALRLCQYNSPDLLLLDLKLPEASGLDVLREIKEPERADGRFDPDLPVIVLSGRGTEVDRVRALELGASDYILKPFSYTELLARIGAVLRRHRTAVRTQEIAVEQIRIYPVIKKVTVDGRAVRLSAKEYGLLVALAKDPLRQNSKEKLLREVFGYHSIGHTRTLEAHASRLRRKLDPENGRYVHQMWGVAYTLLRPDLEKAT